MKLNTGDKLASVKAETVEKTQNGKMEKLYNDFVEETRAFTKLVIAKNKAKAAAKGKPTFDALGVHVVFDGFNEHMLKRYAALDFDKDDLRKVIDTLCEQGRLYKRPAFKGIRLYTPEAAAQLKSYSTREDIETGRPAFKW